MVPLAGHQKEHVSPGQVHKAPSGAGQASLHPSVLERWQRPATPRTACGYHRDGGQEAGSHSLVQKLEYPTEECADPPPACMQSASPFPSWRDSIQDVVRAGMEGCMWWGMGYSQGTEVVGLLRGTLQGQRLWRSRGWRATSELRPAQGLERLDPARASWKDRGWICNWQQPARDLVLATEATSYWWGSPLASHAGSPTLSLVTVRRPPRAENV